MRSTIARNGHQPSTSSKLQQTVFSATDTSWSMMCLQKILPLNTWKTAENKSSPSESFQPQKTMMAISMLRPNKIHHLFHQSMWRFFRAVKNDIMDPAFPAIAQTWILKAILIFALQKNPKRPSNLRRGFWVAGCVLAMIFAGRQLETYLWQKIGSFL